MGKVERPKVNDGKNQNDLAREKEPSAKSFGVGALMMGRRVFAEWKRRGGR